MLKEEGCLTKPWLARVLGLVHKSFIMSEIEAKMLSDTEEPMDTMTYSNSLNYFLSVLSSMGNSEFLAYFLN